MDTNSNEEQKPLAVITGASSGIGYELAKVFAKNGFSLIVCSEDIGISEAANYFRTMTSDVEAVQADLSTEEGVEELFQKILARQDQLNSLVINAGVGVGGEFLETDLEREIKMLNLNVTGLLRLTKKVLPLFVDHGHGRILYTSSIAAEMPGPFYAVYAATKAFVQSFVEAIRFELKDKGIVITALQPGATDTNFFERADMMNTKAGQGKKDDPAEVALDGFNALMAGDDHVVAGSFMNKVQSTVAKFISEKQGAQVHSKSTKPLEPQEQKH